MHVHRGRRVSGGIWRNLLFAALLFPAAGLGETEQSVLRIELAPTNSGVYSLCWAAGHYRRETDAVPDFIVSDKAIILDSGRLPTELPFIADEPDGTGTGYKHLWGDLDGDGEYSAEECMVLDASRRLAPIVKPFKCLVTDAGHRHYVEFQGYLNLLNATPALSLRTEVAYGGAVDIEGQRVQLKLVDVDGDGRITDGVGEARRLDGSGAVLLFSHAPETNRWLRVPFARTIGMCGGHFAADVSFTGDKDKAVPTLQLFPTGPVTTELRFEGRDVVWVTLASTNMSLTVKPVAGRKCLIPIGTWQCLEVGVRQDGQTFKADLRYRHSNKLIANAGEAATLKFGGPLRHSVTVRGGLWSGRLDIRLDRSKGTGGRSYNPVSDRGAEAAGWSVLNSDGTEIASGQFGFG